MNENKKIEKLSETGEQSAKMISGGSKNLDAPRIGCAVMGNCTDCGKTIRNTAYGGYCYNCWRRRNPRHDPISPKDTQLDEKRLSENDLLHVSGGAGPTTQDLNHDRLSHKPNYHHCKLCGKQFSFIEHEAMRCTGAPPFCAKCKTEKHSTQK